MTDLAELFDQIPIDQVADRLGVSAGDAKKAVAAVLPTLMNGLQANAKDPAGAASLLSALQDKDTSLVEGGINLDDVDVKDGKKIVKNIFGANAPDVEDRLGALDLGKDGLVKQLLPILAPIVLAFIASKVTGGNAKASNDSGGWLGDLIGGMVGGGGAGGSGGDDLLGSVLGSVLGGSGGGSGGGLGDLLGGLLGGGKR